MDSSQAVKKKRLANTTKEQYEEYLQFIENDEIMRTGVINPTVPKNYIENKWKELTIKLNAKARGPALSAELWKKRFSDWKNSVRHKYRKYVSEKRGTGGGPEIINPLNDLEERAINVWGRITVDGSASVPEIFGVPAAVENQENRVLDEPCETCEEDIFLVVEGDQQDSSMNVQIDDLEQPITDTIPKATRKQRPRKLNILGEKLLNQVTESTKTQENISSAIEALADTQRELLKFKIAAFKHKNPIFEFSCKYD